jgi:hypothetical protein
VLRKVSISKESLLKQHIKKWSQFEDMDLYAVLVGEWRAASQTSGSDAPLRQEADRTDFRDG